MTNKLAAILISFICLAGCQSGKTDNEDLQKKIRSNEYFEFVKENDGFYEWYTVDNEPRGSGTFRGSAGVLYKAIQMFEGQIDQQQ